MAGCCALQRCFSARSLNSRVVRLATPASVSISQKMKDLEERVKAVEKPEEEMYWRPRPQIKGCSPARVLAYCTACRTPWCKLPWRKNTCPSTWRCRASHRMHQYIYIYAIDISDVSQILSISVAFCTFDHFSGLKGDAKAEGTRGTRCARAPDTPCTACLAEDMSWEAYTDILTPLGWQ